ncbi:MAG: response regulator transcription factor [Bacteroidales bacterium]
MLKILIVDDHTMVREGLKRVLAEEESLQKPKVLEAKDGHEAVLKAKEEPPDVVIMDYDMPHYDGLYGTRELLKQFPGMKILMLSTYMAKDVILESVQGGVKGFLLKEEKTESLVSAIAAVKDGQTWFKGPVAEIIAPYFIAASTGHHEKELKEEALSSREREILVMFAEGLTAREIAEELNISKRTVEVHKARIFKKRQLHNTAQLVRYAVQHNLTKA